MSQLKTLTLLAILVFGFYECTKNNFEGPSLSELYSELEIIDSLQISNTNPDFSTGDLVKFYCKLNRNVDWKINIRGLSSNSFKEFNGFSSTIDSNSINWNGSCQELPFFEIENCAVALTFLNEPDTLRDTISVQGLKNYDDGIVVADFENGAPPPNTVVYKEPNGANMTFFAENDNPLLGNHYFKMGGRVNWDWLLGSIDIPLNLPFVSSSAENFFINIGVLSGINGEFATNQFINIFISESNYPFNDNLSNNGADVFDDSMEVYKYQIKPVDWIGWELTSVSYDQFEIKGVAGGNNIKEPSKIKAIRIQCQACPFNSGNCPDNGTIEVRTDIDHVVFTENGGILEQ